jgi:hypothetical protein
LAGVVLLGALEPAKLALEFSPQIELNHAFCFGLTSISLIVGLLPLVFGSLSEALYFEALLVGHQHLFPGILTRVIYGSELGT